MGLYWCTCLLDFSSSLLAGKVSLEDIVFPKDQCQEKFQQRAQVVVYDENTADPGTVSPTDTLNVVLDSLAMGGKTPYVLVGKWS